MMDVQNTQNISRWEKRFSPLPVCYQKRPKSLELIAVSPSFLRCGKVTKLLEEHSRGFMTIMDTRHLKPPRKSRIKQRPLTWGPARSEDYSIMVCEQSSMMPDSHDVIDNGVSPLLTVEVNNNMKTEHQNIVFKDYETCHTAETGSPNAEINTESVDVLDVRKSMILAFEDEQPITLKIKNKKSKLVSVDTRNELNEFNVHANCERLNCMKEEGNISVDSMKNQIDIDMSSSPPNSVELNNSFDVLPVISTCMDYILSKLESSSNDSNQLTEVSECTSLDLDHNFIISEVSKCIDSLIDILVDGENDEFESNKVVDDVDTRDLPDEKVGDTVIPEIELQRYVQLKNVPSLASLASYKLKTCTPKIEELLEVDSDNISSNNNLTRESNSNYERNSPVENMASGTEWNNTNECEHLSSTFNAPEYLPSDIFNSSEVSLAESSPLRRPSISDMYNNWYRLVTSDCEEKQKVSTEVVLETSKNTLVDGTKDSESEEDDIALLRNSRKTSSDYTLENIANVNIAERQSKMEENLLLKPLGDSSLISCDNTSSHKYLKTKKTGMPENSHGTKNSLGVGGNVLREKQEVSKLNPNPNIREPDETSVTPSLFDVLPASPNLRTSHFILPEIHRMLLPVTSDGDSTNNGDMFSEEIDKVLERPTMRRQDSFAEQKLFPKVSLISVELDIDMVTGEFMPTKKLNSIPNTVSMRENHVVHANENECMQSIETPHESCSLLSRDYLPHPSDLVVVHCSVSKRDSSMSRGSEFSTASSDTMIASEEECLERKCSRPSSCGDTLLFPNSGYESIFSNNVSMGGQESSPKGNKTLKFHKGDKRTLRTNIQSPLVTSDVTADRKYEHEKQHDVATLWINDDNSTIIAELDKNKMSSRPTRIDDYRLGKEASSKICMIGRRELECNSLSSSSISLFSKQSSIQAEGSESSNISSRCSSSATSPTNSPPLSRHIRDIERISPDNNVNEETRAEREATEAFKWLRSAGFPQYASLYEAGQFPINISEVGTDHDFLDDDHFDALCRRLDVLNKCATMKLNKISTDLRTDEEEEEDDEEPCAISENWHYEENQHRWSRLGENNFRPPSEIDFSNSKNDSIRRVDVFASTAEEDVQTTSSSSTSMRDRRPRVDNKEATTKHEAGNHKVKKSNFLKRELKKFRTSSFRRKDKDHTSEVSASVGKKEPKGKAIVISEPQLQSGYEKLKKFRCVPISDTTPDASPSPLLKYQHFNSSQRPRNRKNSSHSITSTSSSSAGGNSSATSTPTTRTRNLRQNYPGERVHSIEELSTEITSPVLAHNRQYLSQFAQTRSLEEANDLESKVFLIPRTHTPGTFPNIMMDPSSSCSTSSVTSASNDTSSSSSSSINRFHPPSPGFHSTQRSFSSNSGHKRPVSIYDNICKTTLNPSTSAQDLLDILDPELSQESNQGFGETSYFAPCSDSFWTVDDIVEQAELLKQQIQLWGNEDSEIGNKFPVDYEHGIDAGGSCPISRSNSNFGISKNELQFYHGNSLNKPLSTENIYVSESNTLNGRKFLTSVSSNPLQLHNLSAGQLMILRRLSVLKLTAMMEKYTSGNNNANSGNKSENISWSIPRFIRRVKVLDYKDKSVFGIPLLHNVQRLGQPIPNCILHAMNYLINTSLDQVGLFRKPGVKSRIQKLREACESNPDMKAYHDWNAYDVADMIKQYFRDLPDPIMTAKLSDTFIGIFLYVPQDLCLQALCAALMMLPDENREALRTLIWFLGNVASNSEENQMTETNLAVCFSPSLFYHAHNNANHNSSSKQMQAASPRARKLSKHGGMALGRPDMKDMNSNMASNQCIAYMIKQLKNLFKIPEDAMTQCRLSVMQQTHDVLRAELGYAVHEGLGRSSAVKKLEIMADFHAYVDRITAQSVREEIRMGHNKSSGWIQIPSVQGSELCYKKVNDGHHLRMWRCRVEIEGVTPEQIMRKILNERHSWDDKLIQCRMVERPDERSECLHLERSEMTANMDRDYCILRSWRTNQSYRDITVIVEISTDHPDVPLQGVRGVVLTSRYVIETASPSVWASDSTSSTSSTGSNSSTLKCHLTHVSRVDTKGRNPEWYNKAYGHITMHTLLRIKETFRLQNIRMYSNNNITNIGK